MTGMGGVGAGMGGPMNEMEDDFDLDTGDEMDDDYGDEGDAGLDMGGDDMADMGDDLGAEEEETVTITKTEFDDAVRNAVDSAWASLSGEGDLDGGLDLDGGAGEFDGLGGDGEDDLDLDGTDEGLDDMGGGLDDVGDDEELESECYGESVNRIAGLLTEDPDVFRSRKPRRRRRRK